MNALVVTIVQDKQLSFTVVQMVFIVHQGLSTRLFVLQVISVLPTRPTRVSVPKTTTALWEPRFLSTATVELIVLLAPNILSSALLATRQSMRVISLFSCCHPTPLLVKHVSLGSMEMTLLG
jgi:hypothetical protein